MERTWFLTVFSARNSDAAISPLVLPPAISDMICDSRADRDLGPCSPDRLSGYCWLPGSSTRPIRPPPPRPPRDRPARDAMVIRPISPLRNYRYTYTKPAPLKP